MIDKIMEFFNAGSNNDYENEYEEYELDSEVEHDDYDRRYSNRYDSYEEEGDDEEEPRQTFFSRTSSKPRVVRRDDINSVRVQIIKPSSYDESRDIILLLKEKQSIIMNLENVSKEEGRRIIDTVSGGVTALDGQIVKITNSIFLAAPVNYKIKTGSENRRKSSFNFM